LQVRGNILMSGSMTLGFNGDVNNYYIKGIVNGLQYTPYSTGDFTFSKGSGNWSFTNGNVGIGTLTPAYPLDVLDDANIANVLHSLIIRQQCFPLQIHPDYLFNQRKWDGISFFNGW
jgi:hypothetical protein